MQVSKETDHTPEIERITQPVRGTLNPFPKVKALHPQIGRDGSNGLPVNGPKIRAGTQIRGSLEPKTIGVKQEAAINGTKGIEMVKI